MAIDRFMIKKERVADDTSGKAERSITDTRVGGSDIATRPTRQRICELSKTHHLRRDIRKHEILEQSITPNLLKAWFVNIRSQQPKISDLSAWLERTLGYWREVAN